MTIRRGGWRSLALALVTFVFAARLAVPDGTMLLRDGGGPRMVICTIDGPLVLDLPSEPGAPATVPADDQCAANAAPPAPPMAQPLPARRAGFHAPSAQKAIADLITGRGLAAPPPPLRGPPPTL